jgi:hypothetical protein
VAARPGLRLLHGGRRTRWRHGNRELVAAPPDRAPFPVERRVVEEDRWRVIGASPDWRPPPPEHPVRLHTELAFEQPTALGRVLCRGRRWHAVVVDLDAEPLVEPAAVVAALDAVARLCTRHAVGALALPLLGTVHGDLETGRALELLRASPLVTAPGAPRRLWLQAPLRTQVVIERALARWQGEGD